MSDVPLRGVELLCPQLGAYGDPLYDNLYERIAEQAASLGATIVRDVRGDPDLHRAHLLGNTNAFALAGSSTVIREETQKFLQRHDELGAAKPSAEPYTATRGRQLSLPFVLAIPSLSGGEGKYLIESQEQLARVRALLDKNHAPISDLGEPYEVRSFIDTPDDHYTSYRVVTAPEGIIAAGLLYSAHKKSEARRISQFDPRRRPITLETNMFGKSSMTAFEDPRSPLFLNARDVCSNIERGGGCIPLMGDNHRPITDTEAAILEAHGINPDSPALPGRIRRPTLVVIREIGRVSGIVGGADFLDDKRLTTGWFLEYNSGPGTGTWNECWNAGSNNVSEADAIRQMHEAALQTLVTARSQ